MARPRGESYSKASFGCRVSRGDPRCFPGPENHGPSWPREIELFISTASISG